MNQNETYMISYLTMKGWECASVSGFNPSHRFLWTSPEQPVNALELHEAFNQQKKEDGDTIPSPPNPEIGLSMTLHELCNWYDEAQHRDPNAWRWLPHELFEQIWSSIGYERKG